MCLVNSNSRTQSRLCAGSRVEIGCCKSVETPVVAAAAAVAVAAALRFASSDRQSRSCSDGK